MEVHFTSDQEARLAQVAIKTGIDAEQLVKSAALRLLEDDAHSDASAPAMPVLRLGAMTSLQRRDIYDDVR